MSNTLVMILIFVAVGVFFYFSAKNAKKTDDKPDEKIKNDAENN